MTERTLTIGEVAVRAGVRASSVRHWEAVGVLPLPERASGARRYGPQVLEDIERITVAQRAGFSLAEIRELLDGVRSADVPGDHVRVLGARKLTELDALIERATAVRGWLQSATDCRCPTLADCGLFDAAPGDADRDGCLRPPSAPRPAPRAAAGSRAVGAPPQPDRGARRSRGGS